MRKLNKAIKLAKDYKKWYPKNKRHKYDSSNNEFYYDVLYELLIIQDGLCAYTEYRLIEKDVLKKIKDGFVRGKYSIPLKPNIPAHLEHFNKLQKPKFAWDWENFFAVFDHVNDKKNHLEDIYGINNILKPDLKVYDCSKSLSYDKDLHMFYPNLKLPQNERDLVNKMILVLGLNNDFIKMVRRDYLKTIKALEGYKGKPQSINQFPTAYSMI